MQYLNQTPPTMFPPVCSSQIYIYFHFHTENLRPINLRRRCLVTCRLMRLRSWISATSLMVNCPGSPSRT